MKVQEKLRYGRQEMPQRKVARSGDHTVLSSQKNKSSGKFMEDIDPSMPEKLRDKKVLEQSKMTSVKSSVAAEKDKSPEKLSHIALDTGDVEVGYDKENHELVMGFVYKTDTGRSKEVVESSSVFGRLINGEKIRSNDKYFYGGATEIRLSPRESITPQKIRRQINDASNKADGLSTVDRVLPFYNRKNEERSLDLLRDEKRQKQSEKSNLNTAITGIQTFVADKDQREKQFFQKLVKATEKINETRESDDSYILFKKKQLEVLDNAALGIDRDIEYSEEYSNENTKE